MNEPEKQEKREREIQAAKDQIEFWTKWELECFTEEMRAYSLGRINHWQNAIKHLQNKPV